MVDKKQRVDYFHTTVQDRPGESRRLLEFLSAHSVNLIAFTAFPLGARKAQLAFFTEDAEHLKRVAADAGIDLIGPKKAFLIQGEDRVGALVEYHLVLANAGINVYASNGVNDGTGRFGYILWVLPEDYEKAAEALGI